MMECEFCKLHILATTQISWKGYNFHTTCIGSYIAQEAQPQATRQPGEDDGFIEAYEDEEPFDDELSQYEEDDDLEDIIEALDNEPQVDDEILRQIPVSTGNGGGVIIPEVVHQMRTNGEVIGSFQMPQGAMIAAPRAIIHPPLNGGNGHGNLIAGAKGSRYVEYPELRSLPLPEATATFKPIGFYEFVSKLLQGLWDRRMAIVKDQYIISADGMKLFGLIELENEYNGVRFAVGLRTSNDKSTKLALAVGYKVMCCSNGMLQGDFLPLAVKHSANLELDDALALGIDRIRRRFGDLQSTIQAKQEKLIENGTAKQFIYDAFTTGKFPVSLFRTVNKEYFIEPSYEEFKPRTVFSLENAFTTAFKKLQPLQQFEQTARLGKFLAALN